LGKFLDRVTDDRRDLRRSYDLRCENSKLSLAVELRAKRSLLALRSLDAFKQIAGSVT
jgi:hypothetical protein